MRGLKTAVLFSLLSCSFLVNASSSSRWESLSDVGEYGLVGFALGLPAYKEDWGGFKQAGYSLVGSTGVSWVSKSLISEKRPDNSDDDSFPSNHAAAAFASATTVNLRYGWELGLPAYGMASLVAVGRVEAKKHYWKDVIAGAVIGSLSSWIFTDAFNEGVQVLPWVSKDEAGFMVSVNW